MLGMRFVGCHDIALSDAHCSFFFVHTRVLLSSAKGCSECNAFYKKNSPGIALVHTFPFGQPFCVCLSCDVLLAQDHKTALIEAAKRGHPAVVSTLLAAKAILDADTWVGYF